MEVTEIKEKVVPVLRSAGVLRAALFGSAARGEATKESDVDILVSLPKGTSLFDFVALKLKLEDVLRTKVDLVEYASIKSDLKSYILKDELALI